MFRNQQIEFHKKKSERGFTIIEVMIAISIFAIGFLAISSLLFSSSRNNRTASEVTEAITIATDQMERMMAIDFTHSDLDPDQNPHVDAQGKYAIEWLVSNADLNTDGYDDAKVINITISFDRLGDSADRLVRLDFIKPDA